MTSSPLTPLKKFGRIGYYRQGGSGSSCGNPWISVDRPPKSLISQAKCSTGLHVFSTESPQYSTCLPIFSTRLFFACARLFLYISLFLKEKKKKRGGGDQKSHPRETTIACFFIHGFWFVFRQTRGNSWNAFASRISHLAEIIGESTNPRAIFSLGGVDRG